MPLTDEPNSPLVTRRHWLLGVAGTSLIASCGGSSDSGTPPVPPPTVNGPAWTGFGRDAQHSAISAIATQPLTRIQWKTAVDLQPEYSNGNLLSHYGSPVITSKNTVVVPVKTTAPGGFRLEARAGASGVLMWSAASDYVLPPHSWTPSFNPALTASNRVYAPALGGRLLQRNDVDSASGTQAFVVFYGQSLYDSNRANFDARVFVNTPITADNEGNLFFGFLVTGANPANLRSGLARVSANGEGIWVAAQTAAADTAIDRVAMNCAPALSRDSKTVYLSVITAPVPGARQSGYLLALDANTLVTRSKVPLIDPATGTPAWISENSTASPTVGPDGSVFYGVLEANPPAHNFRGWLLSFSGDLSQSNIPASFGWDDTASVVPAAVVPTYRGPSSYLLMIKYNNYGGTGTGDGKNRLAIVDPKQSQADFISGIPVMLDVLTILGVTPDAEHAGGVKEWCINTAAVDPFTSSVLVNNEDGYLYRWDLSTNSFTQKVQLTSGLGEAYTPTAIGPDGAVFAINNGVVFSVGR